jgi:hypothetical protein
LKSLLAGLPKPKGSTRSGGGRRPPRWPTPPKIRVIVKYPELDLVTKCDKCGNRDILYMSRDRQLVVCKPCMESLSPALEGLGYGPMTGWTGFFTKIPHSMRLWTKPQEPKPQVQEPEEEQEEPQLLPEKIRAPRGARKLFKCPTRGYYTTKTLCRQRVLASSLCTACRVQGLGMSP